MSTDESETGNGRLAEHAVLAKLAWALHSEPGEVRPHNEDFAGAYAPTTPDDAWDRGPLWIVADGMGGHAAGEVASRVATEAALTSWTKGSPAPPSSALRDAFRMANATVHEAGREAGRRGMGTTMVALTFAGAEMLVANVGDSRAYRVRDGDCTQLTTDHSRVAEMLRMRMISPEQAATHPARSMLTRSLGADLMVQIDIAKEPVRKGDTFVLCTDGLWDVVSRADIAGVGGALDTGDLPTPAAAAEQLVSTAIKRGTADNVTAVVVRITSDRPIPAAGARRLFFRRGRP
ncbi:MAG: PP2C family protein-serine/threonine phosphatase [Acidimicrobiales bacterium]